MAQIHWAFQVNGVFTDGADWVGGVAPGVADDAILDASGSTAYTVTSSATQTVHSIQTASTATLSITGGTFTALAGTGSGANAGTILIGNDCALTICGAFDNIGAIDLDAFNYATNLIVGAAVVNLTGGGQVVLNDDGNNAIYGAVATDTLTNVDNTISGAGQLGGGQLTLVNETAGVIDATGTNNALVLDTSGETVTNDGLIEGTGAAGLVIRSTTVDDSGGGVIEAAAGSLVNLESADIVGGEIDDLAGGTIQTTDGGSQLDGRTTHPVAVLGALSVANNTALTIQGAINLTKRVGNFVATGAIDLNAYNYNATLIVGASGAVITGGRVTLVDDANNQVIGTLSGSFPNQVVSKLTNRSIISGAGAIGASLSLTNDDIIDATGANALIIATGAGGVAGSNVVTNDGVLEATNPGDLGATGGLRLSGSVFANIAGHGIIVANGAASHVDLQSATIEGGTLETLNGGVVQTIDANSVFDGVSLAVNNQGQVDINNDTALTIEGVIDNSDSINLEAYNYGTDLIVGAAGATLTGGGQINLVDDANNLIDGVAAADTLTNVDDIISGSGRLGGSQLTLVNEAAGVIDASGTNNALILDTNGETFINDGIVEATGAAGLLFQSTTINDSSGGVLLAATGSAISLATADIQGGALETSGSGVIHTVDFGSTLDGTASPVANQGQVDINNNTGLTILGAIDNSGSLDVNGANYGTDLIIGAANATLTGGGQVVLNDDGNNLVGGAAVGDTLTNVDNTISGAGQFGGGRLSLVNEAAGVIDASGTNNALVLNTSGETVTNDGLVEATGAAGLVINSTTVNDTGGGLIEAANGSHVNLQTADIFGGVIDDLAGGVIQTVDGGSQLDGRATHPVTVLGALTIDNDTALTIQGAIDLTRTVGKIVTTGVIDLSATNYGTTLIVGASGATIAGGEVVLNDDGNNQIVGTLSGPTNQVVSKLTNRTTISGAGAIGVNLSLTNDDLIDATGANALIVSTGNGAVAGSNVVTNDDLLEATNPGALTSTGGLRLSGVTVANVIGHGVILATGTTTHVDLQSATIEGGTLETLDGGVIQTIDYYSVFNGLTSTVTNEGVVQIDNNTRLTLEGAIDNAGSIDLEGNNYDTDLQIGANAVLTGGGQILLNDDGNNRIYGAVAADTLTNVNNTISGAGQFGIGQLTFVNETAGVIDATGANRLLLDTDQTVINDGLMEATGAGGLTLYYETVDNTGGGVFLAASGSSISLQSSDIIGGQLKTFGSGVIQTVDSGSVFDATTSTVTIQGVVQINNDTRLTIEGAIDNTGSIDLEGNNYDTDLQIGANATLTGGGQILLNDDGNNRIYGAVAADTLTNVNNVISGAGQFGVDQMTFINEAAGVLDATGTNNALTLETDGKTVTNDGLIEATGAGGLLIYYTTVNDTGGGQITVTVGSHVNLQSTDIVGGPLKAVGSGYFQTIDSGSVLDGTGLAIDNEGPVEINNDTALTLDGAIVNTGAFDLNGSNYDTDLVIGSANVTLSGGGRIVLSDSANSRIYGETGTAQLTNVNNVISGAGQLGAGQLTLVNDAAGVIDATGTNNALTLYTSAQTVTNKGMIEATGAGGLFIYYTTVDDAGGGVVQATGGSHVTLQGADMVGGTILSVGSGFFQTAGSGTVFDGTASTMTNGALVEVNNDTNLTLLGAIDNSGSIDVDGANYTTDLVLASNVTLTGGGQIVLADSANTRFYGASGAVTLTNVDNTISGAGQFGVSQLTLVNDAAGLIDATGANALIINTGALTITNAGLIEATGSGGASIQSALINTGVLEVNGGNLTETGAVTGGGSALIVGGTMDFTSTFTENVTFDAVAGTLELAQSQSYTGAIRGFTSHGSAGTDVLDLRDIGFFNANEANFVGTASGGVLTVIGGNSVAQINLVGNYTLATFTAASDGNGGTDITVNTTTPIARADSYSVAVDGKLSTTRATGVLANDVDPTGLTLSAALVPGGGPQHGTLTLNTNGSFTYTPDAGYSGTDSFSYVASDKSGAKAAPATVSISVVAADPVSNPDTYSGSAGQPLTVFVAFGVLANDTDPNGLPLTAALAPGGGPAHGTLTFNANGSFIYTPNLGFAGADTFTYIASDGVASGPATTVTINVAASAPTSGADKYADAAGHNLTVAAATGVLANDTDPNGLALTAALATGPSHGVLALNANGSFTYSPDLGFAGADTFTYIASDGLTAGTPTTVTINVKASPPTSQAETYDDGAGQTLTVTAAGGVLAKDTDPNGLALTAALTAGGAPTHGTLTLNADGSFTYTPDLGFAGTDTFKYIASDSLASGPVTTVAINVAAAAPTSQSYAFSDAAGHALAVAAASGVLSNDTDPNGLTLSAKLAAGGAPKHGTLTLNADGSFTYTPAAGFAGTDSFTYIPTDAVASGAAAMVTIDVTAGAPKSETDGYHDAAGQTVNIAAATGVLANDTDPNGLALSAALATGGGPAHGTLTLNANGSFSYTPDPGFVGLDTFSYIAGDSLASGPATVVTITVTAGAPVSNPDAYGDPINQTLTTTAANGVLANDTDSNGLPLTAALVPGGGPTNGTLTLNANGSFTYTPNAGFSGTDSFSYIASDGLASTPATLVTIDVGVGTPVSSPETYGDHAGHALITTAATGVLAKDSDPNGLPLTASLAPGGGPAHGTLTLNADGSFTYTPTLGFAGTDTFTYIASDSLAAGPPTVITINVTASPPTSAPETYGDNAGHALTTTAATGVLAQDTDLNGLPLTAALAPGGGPSHGVLTLNADGSFTYTPTLGFAGTDSFTYIPSDSLASGTATKVTIDVNASPPISQPESYGDGAGQVLTTTAATGVLAKDTDPNGLQLTAALAPGGGPSHGTLTLNANGSFTYTPAKGFTGADTFTYIPSDSLVSGSPTVVTINVGAGSITSNPDSYGDNAGQGLTTTAANGVLANDSDTSGLPLTAALAPGGGPSHGTLTLNANGSFTYTPDLGFAGTDTFTYIASDNLGSGSPTLVSINVAARAPTSSPETYGDNAGQGLTTTAATGVLAKDTDLNGLALTAALAPGGGPSHGTLTLNANGSFTYTPNLGFAGTDSFTYIPSDSLASGSPTTVTIDVTARAPTSSPETYGDNAGQGLTTTAATGVLAKDTDLNGLALTAALAPGGGPSHGTLTLNANGSFTYTPDLGFAGTDSFTYIPSDSLASGSPTTVTIDVTARAPTSSPETYGDNAGQGLTTTAATGVLAKDTDLNGLALTAALAPGGGPSHGTLTLNANGSFTYTPDLGFAGTDSFTYIPSDSLASGSPTTVTIDVTARAPTSSPETYGDNAGQGLTTTAATGVLAKDTDLNGLALTAALAPGGGPSHGTLTLNANGSFTYTPDLGFAGTDSFTYIPSDSLASGSPTTVTIDVTARAPTSSPETYGDNAGQGLTTTAATGVLAKDTDLNGLALTAALAPGGGPSHGTLTLNANGSFTYTPNLGFAGTDSFTYIPSDSLASGSPTTVTIDVTARAPTSSPETYGDNAGQGLTTTAATGVLAKDTDLNGLALTAALAPGGGPSHGTLTLNANGSFTYTPDLGFAGTDTFTYIASDNLGSGSPTLVSINVAARAPTSSPETYGDNAGQGLTTTAATGVLAKDTDLNGLALTAALAPGGGPSHGTLTLNANGSFTYTPNLGFAGTDSFTYIPSDSLASGSPTTVTIDVTARAPTASPQTYADQAGQTLSVAVAAGVLAGDTDPNGLALTAAVAPGGGPSHGTLTLNANGSFTYTPNLGFAGVDSFTYIASDGLASSAPAIISVDVTAGAPVALPHTYSAITNQTLTVGAQNGVLAGDTDPNGLALTASLAPGGGPIYGTLTLNPDGSFSYILNAGFGGFVGTDTFSYIASDGLASSAPTQVTIDVSNSGSVSIVAPAKAATSLATVEGLNLPRSADWSLAGLALSWAPTPSPAAVPLKPPAAAAPVVVVAQAQAFATAMASFASAGATAIPVESDALHPIQPTLSIPSLRPLSL